MMAYRNFCYAKGYDHCSFLRAHPFVDSFVYLVYSSAIINGWCGRNGTRYWYSCQVADREVCARQTLAHENRVQAYPTPSAICQCMGGEKEKFVQRSRTKRCGANNVKIDPLAPFPFCQVRSKK
jgi:hypothetical protein